MSCTDLCKKEKIDDLSLDIIQNPYVDKKGFNIEYWMFEGEWFSWCSSFDEIFGSIYF